MVFFFGVEDNQYTNDSMHTLEGLQGSIHQALTSMRSRFDIELERQRYKDRLCQQFASLADPLSKFIIETKEAITTSSGNLEEQLSLVLNKLSTIDDDGKVLSQIKEVENHMHERNITHNEHTALTLKDIEVQWDQYKTFLQNKEQQIKEEIENAKLRGLTQEDLKEIEDNFRSFDKNRNNFLELNELKACLYSLGEERSKTQIEDLVHRFGDGTKLFYEQFFELMVQVLGDSDTLDEVISGFRLINKTVENSPPVATVQKLGMVMEDPFVHYIMEKGTPLEDGIDYVNWSEVIFSR